MAPGTAAEYARQARLYLSRLSSRKVADVDRADIERALENASPVQFNRVLAFISRLFNLVETWGWRPQHTNPVKGIERNREEPRDRVLNDSELSALAQALERVEPMHPAPVAAIRVAAMSGLRIAEVLGMRWQDIDVETGRIDLPTTKTGKRVHHLGPAALAIIEARPRISSEPWVFSTGRGRPTYAHVRRVFAKVVADAGLANCRLHDLRRTAITALAAAGASAFLVRDFAGHRTLQMAGRYVRAGQAVVEARRWVDGQMATALNGGTR